MQALLAATAWSRELVNVLLDQKSRLALSQANKECRELVLEAADHTTVTLLAHGGLSVAAWQRRLASAEALSARGQQGLHATLVLRAPTPVGQALESVFELSESAGTSITELRVSQQASAAQHEGVHTAWLRGLPATFPNLRILTMSRLCGRLPPSFLLPHLKELSVQLCPAFASAGVGSETAFTADACSLDEQCDSIAPYVHQLTALHIGKEWGQPHEAVSWPRVFRSVSITLQRFITDQQLSNELTQALLACAPALTHITCGLVHVDGLADKAWSVTELRMLASPSCTVIEGLPQSPAPGLTPLPTPRGVVELTLDVKAQGLSQATTQQLKRLRFAAPCHVHLTLPRHPIEDELQVSIEAALRQLTAIPAGSTIDFDDWNLPWRTTVVPAAAAIRAATGDMLHVKIWLPAAPGNEIAYLAWLLHAPNEAQAYNVSLRNPNIDGVVSRQTWCWRSLRLVGYVPTTFRELLHLPDPPGGQYEIEMYNLSASAQRWSTARLARLEQRLQHWTFVLGAYMTIDITSPYKTGLEEQHIVLERTLRVLRGFRWRRDVGSGPCTLILRGWCLHPGLITRLGGLPDFGFPVRLTFRDCFWLPDNAYMQLASFPPGKAEYKELPSFVPACYNTWCNDITDSDTAITPEHVHIVSQHTKAVCSALSAMCMGAAARGEGGQKLSLVVNYSRGQLSDAQRSAVEACVDERGLGRWVGDIKWVMFPPSSSKTAE